MLSGWFKGYITCMVNWCEFILLLLCRVVHPVWLHPSTALPSKELHRLKVSSYSSPLRQSNRIFLYSIILCLCTHEYAHFSHMSSIDYWPLPWEYVQSLHDVSCVQVTCSCLCIYTHIHISVCKWTVYWWKDAMEHSLRVLNNLPVSNFTVECVFNLPVCKQYCLGEL